MPFEAAIASDGLMATQLALYPGNDLVQDAGMPADGSGFNAASLGHNVPSKRQVDQVMAEAESAASRIIKPAHDIFGGG